MSVGRERNYVFGQKNHWRRTVWNEVLRRTNGREKTEPVLYLAGPQDNDRAIATEKGVPNENLIAIDTDLENVERVRRQGGLAIHAEIVDVLWSWPAERPVCAVILDYCSGIEWANASALDPLFRKPFQAAVFAGNFQRGRDAWSNDRRRTALASLDPSSMGLKCERKHRGWALLAIDAIENVSLALQPMMAAYERELGNEIEAAELEECCSVGEAALFMDEDGAVTDGVAILAMKWLDARRPRFFTYRSGVLTFDSFVCESAVPPPVREQVAAEYEHKVIPDRKLKERDVARRISATLAVRTTRLSV